MTEMRNASPEMQNEKDNPESPELAREKNLRLAAKIWKALPVKVRAHMAQWLAIVYRVQICAIIRNNGHCPCQTCDKEKKIC